MNVNVEAYKEWMNLYTKETEEIWLTERKELRKSAMILKTLEQEFKKIQDTFNLQLSQFRDQYETFEKHKSLLSPDNSDNMNSNNFDGDTVLASTSSLEETAKPIICDESMDIMCSPAEFDTKPEIKIEDLRDDSLQTSPRINKQKKYYSKRKSKFNSLNCTISSKTLEKKQLPVREVVTPKPPNEDDDLINCTVIDGTPVLNRNLRKTRTLFEASKRANVSRLKKSRNSTLTQMFANSSNNKVKTVQPESADMTDITFCGDIDVQNVLADENLPMAKNKNCDDKKKREVICKEPVVRGKARQKLEGFDCKECRKFYEVLGVNTPERKRLQNQCSRHRATRQPLNETPAGFWSLSFPPTQDTIAEQSDASMVYQY